jgi:hypothetical protein
MDGKIFTSQCVVDKYDDKEFLVDKEMLKHIKYMMAKDFIAAIMDDPEFGNVTKTEDVNTNSVIYSMKVAVMPPIGYEKLVQILERTDIILFDESTNTQIRLRDLL